MAKLLPSDGKMYVDCGKVSDMATQAQQTERDASETERSDGERPISRRASSWTPEAILKSGLVLIGSTIRNKDLPMHQRLQAARVAMTSLSSAGIKPSERDLRVVFRRAARGERLADDAPAADSYSNTSTDVYTAQRNDRVTERNGDANAQREVQSEVLAAAGGTTHIRLDQNSLSPSGEDARRRAVDRAERELRDFDATIAQHRAANVPVARCDHIGAKQQICGRKLPCALHTPKFEPW